MLARRVLPDEFKAWNARWGAPNGSTPARPLRRLARRRTVRWRYPRVVGPFGFQANNETRRFEYPWAFHARPVAAGTRCLDIGGSLAGFQFVLARSGADVTNVDPGEEAAGVGWPVDGASIAHLNAAFGTDVRFVGSTLQEAGLPAESVDVVYSISTIEHVPAAELPSLMAEIARVLRPGGAFVGTVDLFLNLEPFSDRVSNHFGVNVSIKDLLDWSGMELVAGDPAELLGFGQFSARGVLARLDEYLVGGYPALAQCVVFGKPPAG